MNNGKFCMEQDKGNADNINLKKNLKIIRILRSKNLPTIPTILKR